jgi:hypothetical protein
MLYLLNKSGRARDLSQFYFFQREEIVLLGLYSQTLVVYTVFLAKERLFAFNFYVF